MDRLIAILSRGLALEGLDRPENRDLVRAGLVIAALAVAIRVIFWAYTQRYWEDALIAVLHTENFANGLGLTHDQGGGSPVMGFSSPIGVLIPMIGDLVRVGWGIELIKLASLPAAALTVLYVLAFCVHPAVRMPWPLAVAGMGYVAFEHHQILWGMAGMETQFATIFPLMALYYLLARRPAPLALSLALCMYARPDFVFVTLVAGAYVLIRMPRLFAPIAGGAFALYAPWLAFTTLYYGSPVPNPVIAKGLGYAPWWERADAVNLHAAYRQLRIALAEHLYLPLGPTFGGHGAGIHRFFTDGPESPIANALILAALMGGFVVLVRRQWPLWPLAACVAAYSLYYAYLVPNIFGWYKVPVAAMALLLGLRGLQALSSPLAALPRLRHGVLGVFAALYLGLFLGVLPVTFETERAIQRDIEDAVRKQAGLYLREHMALGEAVACEPAGYIGYHARGLVHDWPGLASGAVVAWSRAHPASRSLEAMIHAFEPEYLFLRDIEVRYYFDDPNWLKSRYHVAAVFQADSSAARRVRWIDKNIDTHYRVYRRNDLGEVGFEGLDWP